MTKTAPDSIQLIELDNGKANAIDEALLAAIWRGLDQAQTSGKRAVVLTGYQRYFSAGLNLKNLPADEPGMRSFIETFEALNLRLLRYPLPVLAAVNGHAVAGGCVLACACDVRLGAAGAYGIGTSEVSLGIAFPASAFEIMREVIVSNWTARVLLGGELLPPVQAQQAGILHDVVRADELLSRAFEMAVELGAKPVRAFEHSKLALHAPTLERIERTAETSRDEFIETWFSDEVVARREAILAKE